MIRATGEPLTSGRHSSANIKRISATKLKQQQTRLAAALLLLPLLLLARPSASQRDSGCKRVHFGPKSELNIACQCDSTHCDSLDFEWPEGDREFVRVASDKSGRRFQVDRLDAESLVASGAQSADFAIDVQTNNRRQQIVGFGGGLTDAAAINILGLPERAQQFAFDDYFGARGLDYNMLRVPCAGTDMSTRVYSYADLPAGEEDLELRTFKLAPEDLELKIPFLRRANAMRAARSLAELKLLTASWAPPLWMKSNRQVSQGFLRGDSRGKYYDAYARYLVRFLDEYQRHNVTFWGLAAQNEPYTTRRVGISFNSVNFHPEQLANFIEFALIPALLASGRTPDKLLLFPFDDNLNGHEPFTQALLNRSAIVGFARGLARHWYIKDEMPYIELSIARLQYPANYLAASTEASFIGRPRPGSWNRAELYALDIMETLLAGFNAWVDWNLALDMQGGPTWVGNHLDAAILVDPPRGRYFKNPMYYALGHITRFVRPDSRLLASRVTFADAGEPANATADDYEAQMARHAHRLQEYEPSVAVDALVASQMEKLAETLSGKPQVWYTRATKTLRPLTVVAVELAAEQHQATPIERRFALVALNRAMRAVRVELRLAECLAVERRLAAAGNASRLLLELSANSITSFAFNC